MLSTAEPATSVTLTSRQLADTLIGIDASPGLAAGRLRYYAAQPDVPAVTRDYAEAVARGLSVADVAKSYRHPAADVRPVPASQQRQKELTPADLAWLSSLPTDPNKVSYADASQLAQLVNNLSSDAPATNRQLLAHHWEPVRDAYDRRQVQHALSRTYVTLPDPTHAIAGIVGIETNELSPTECALRGEEIAETIHQAMIDNRHRDRAYADSIITEVDRRVRERTSTEAPQIVTAQD